MVRKVKVFHNPDFIEHFLKFDVKRKEKDFKKSKLVIEYNDFNNEYKTVTETLDTAFRLTNNIDESWKSNFGIHGDERSTSIGDFVQVNDVLYGVDGCGFMKL